MGELTHWIELAQPFPTCYSPSTESSSRIDRGWTTAKSPAILLLDVTSSVNHAAEDNYTEAISDHAMMDYTFASRRAHNASSGVEAAIPSAICKHPMFSEMVNLYAEHLQIHNLPNEEQLQTLNATFKEAGRIVRDHLIVHDSTGQESKRLVLNAIARAVWGKMPSWRGGFFGPRPWLESTLLSAAGTLSH